MSKLITEIERVKQLMGLANDIKPLINENVGILGKLARQATEVFDDVAENKAMIKNLDNLRAKGVKALTEKEIDDLAEALARDAKTIKGAMSNVSYDAGIQSLKRIASIDKLKQLIIRTKRAEADALMNLFIEKQLFKIFEDGYGPWGQAYNRAMTETMELLDTYVDNVVTLTEDELISFFLDVVEKELKDGEIVDFKFSDYPEYVSWINKKLLPEGGTLDDIIDTGRSAIKKSGDRYTAASNYFSGKKTNFNPKTKTDLGDIKIGSLTNFRLVTNAFRRFRSWFQGNKTLMLNYERNVALLKGFPVENILKEVNGKTIPSNDFVALIRNIGFDIDQIATLENNTLKRWESLMDEVEKIDPKLSEGMKEVPIYKEVGNGWLWQEEKVSAFIDRLKLRYEAPMKEGGGWWGELKVEALEFWRIISLSKESILAATSNTMKGIAGFIQGLASRRFFSAGIWGVPITPKQVGLLLSKRGFNRAFLISFIESWFMLQLWQNVVSSIVVILSPLFEFFCNKVMSVFKWDTRCSDDLRTIEQYWKESLTSIWADGSSYLNIGFEKGFLIKAYEWFREDIIEEPISEIEIGLVEDADKYTKQFWSSLSEQNQEKLLKTAAEENSSDFQKFSQVTNTTNKIYAYMNTQFIQRNKITTEESQKLYNARVLTPPQSVIGKISAEEAKNLIKGQTKLSKIEDYLKVGGVEDKDGIVYTIKKGKDSIYDWTFDPPAIQRRYGVQPVGNNDAFYIYLDDTSKEVVRLSANDLKKEGFSTGFNEQGLFESEAEAKKVRNNLQERHPSVPQKSLTIKEMIAKL